MILCIGTTPAAQRVMVFDKFELDAVNRALDTQDGFAGKSINVAKVLAHLGQRAFVTGFAGGERGRALVSALATRGIQHEFVTVDPTTRQCATLLDQSTGMVTELVEESRPVGSTDYETLETIVHNRLSDCQAVVMSGSLTPGGPVDFYQRITRVANQRGLFTIVDAQGPPLIEALKAQPGLVKPNRRELAGTVQRVLRTEEDLIEAMREVRERGAQQIVVTGGKEAALASDGRHIWRIHSPKIKVVNPIGSGDSFTAALVWRLIQAEPLGEACRWAAAAGAANALSLMPGELNLEEVEQLAAKVKVEKL